MKNLPYSSCFVVVQINNKIEKMYFDEIVKYADHTDCYLDAFKEYFVSIAFSKSSESGFLHKHLLTLGWCGQK